MASSTVRVVQWIRSAPGFVTTHNVILPAASVAGNGIALILIGNTGAGDRDVTSVTCTSESNLTVGVAHAHNGGAWTEFCYLPNITTADTKTLGITLDGSSDLIAYAVEVSGQHTSSFVDNSGTSAAGSGADPSVTFSTSNDGCAIFSFIRSINDHHWTPQHPAFHFSFNPGGSGASNQMQYDAGTAGSKTHQFTTSSGSGNHAMGMVAVRPATAPTGIPRLVQHTPPFVGSGSTITLTLPSTLAGSGVGVIITLRSTTTTITSVTCSGESDFTVSAAVGTNGTDTDTIYYAYLNELASGGTKTIVVNMSTALGTGARALAYEVAGGSTTSFLAQIVDVDVTTGDPVDLSLTTGADDSLYIAAYRVNDAENSVLVTQPHRYMRTVPSDNSGSMKVGVFEATGTSGSKTIQFNPSFGARYIALKIEHGIDLSQDGECTFETLDAEGSDGSASGTVSTEQMTAEGFGSNDGAATFESMTAFGFDFEAAGIVTLESLTALGEAPNQAQGAVTSSQLTASGQTPNNATSEDVETGTLTAQGFDANAVGAPADGSGFDLVRLGASPGLEASGTHEFGTYGEAELEALDANGYNYEAFANVSFEEMEGEGINEASTNGLGVPQFQAMTATGVTISDGFALGEAEFPVMTASGTSGHAGAVTFPEMTAAGVVPNHAVGMCVMEPVMTMHQAAAVELRRMEANGQSVSSIPEVYAPKVVNVRTGAVTEFTNHSYNSFARIGTQYYAAGPSGLVRLTGATDPSSAPINWVVKTGRMDDKEVELKRLPEVLLGLRSNGKITVRIHPDENVSYDYKLPVVQKTTIHQHRVEPGRGMRSRWYAVELRGQENATLELASMQVNMTKTTRRLG